MQLVVCGLNHQTAPLAVREKLALSGDALPAALRAILDEPGVAEAMILSTCNRTEIYAHTEHPQALAAWLARYRHMPTDWLAPHGFAYAQEEAVRHAFRVASGLDSMVVGETQILGQMKDSVAQAQQQGCLGGLLGALFQRTFAVAKEVRSQTGVGAHSVSMAAAAVRLALRVFPSMGPLHVLLIGAGEMIELCAQHVLAQQPQRITLANRTLERAEALAQNLSTAQGPVRWDVIALESLATRLAEYDVVISCTGSPLPLLGKGLVERALKVRRHRPIFMVDLAVPRDIEPEVAELNDVFLYTVDDLAELVREGWEQRRQSVQAAEHIIQQRVLDFQHWQQGRRLVPMIRQMRDQAERARRHELQRARRQLERGEAATEVLEQLASRLCNKLLHPPTQVLHHGPEELREPLLALFERAYQHPESEPGDES